VKLIAGLWLFGTGEAMLVAANLGNSPWTVLAQGVAFRTHLSVGMVTNILGLAILMLWIPLRQRPGLGTVSNIVIVGVALDVTLALLPHWDSLLPRLALTLGGIAVVALGSGLYLGTGLGPGPRDGLMTGVSRVTRQPLGLTRAVVELSVLGVGFLLGGVAGVGTVLFAVLIGPLVHAAVRLLGRLPDDQL
jgi:uncharacterized membrane protein YczE